MVSEKSYSKRAKIIDTGGKLQIIIPSEKNRIAIIFLSCWLTGWAVGEVFAIFLSVKGIDNKFAKWFILFWLCGWTIGGFFAFLSLSWMIAGKEIITIYMGILKIERKVLNLGSAKEYSLLEARNFRIDNAIKDIKPESLELKVQKPSSGNLVFDYGKLTVKFANGIDEEEAKSILELIKWKGGISQSSV